MLMLMSLLGSLVSFAERIRQKREVETEVRLNDFFYKGPPRLQADSRSMRRVVASECRWSQDSKVTALRQHMPNLGEAPAFT